MQACFRTLRSASWVCVSVFTPGPHCLHNSFETGKCEASIFALLFQHCFGYSVFLAFPNGFQHWLVYFCNKKKERKRRGSGDLAVDRVGPVVPFVKCRRRNSIKSSDSGAWGVLLLISAFFNCLQECAVAFIMQVLTLGAPLIYESFNLLNVTVTEVAFLYSLAECVPL